MTDSYPRPILKRFSPSSIAAGDIRDLQSADLLGTVFIYVDYRVPTQAVRDELQRILKASELWDG